MGDEPKGWAKISAKIQLGFWKWLGIDKLWERVELAMMGVEQNDKDLAHHISQHQTGEGSFTFPRPSKR